MAETHVLGALLAPALMQGDATKTIQNALANLKKVSEQLGTILSDSK
jgi:hypothetical protein